MLKQERADHVLHALDHLYPETPIPLDHSDPFTLLVAVVLSAQCTDKKVNEITPDLFAVGGAPQSMAALGQPAIYEIIKPLGLSKQKSKSLAKLSEIILEKHDGCVPQDWEALEALPGVGHKTASVVMSQAFGVPAFPVDTHIHRLAQRWGLASGKNVVDTENSLKKLFPREHWNRLHLQIIFYGREYCSARGCDGTVCEMCRTLYPKRKKPVQLKKP